MTSISKNVYIDKLDDIADEYNNTYHRTIKLLIMLLMISIVKKLLEHFMKKNCRRLIKKNLELKK